MQENREVKAFEVVNIVDSGTNKNKFSGKDETWFSTQVAEYQGDEKVGGRPVYGGKTIGKTFLEKQEGGWIRLLKKVVDPDNDFDYKDTPVFKGFIHECETAPYYIRRKDADGEWKYETYDKDHEDEGQRVIANKFKLLLTVDENPDVAVADFLGRQKMVDTATLDATIKKYTVGGKAYNLLSLTNETPPEEVEAVSTKKDKKDKDEGDE